MVATDWWSCRGKEARNYPDQGSGADILVTAIAMFPGKIAKMLRLPCHDELLFEVPADEVAEVLPIVKAIVIQARRPGAQACHPGQGGGPGRADFKPARIPSPLVQGEPA
jgi:hypothetical protein